MYENRMDGHNSFDAVGNLLARATKKAVLLVIKIIGRSRHMFVAE